MIRVLLDAHQLGRRQTGNETYVRELVNQLRLLPELDLWAAVEDGQEPIGPLSPPVDLRRVPRNGLGRLVAMSVLGRKIRADLIHAIYFLPPVPGRRTVVTIHDISFERHPEFFSRKSLVRDRLLIRDAARRATKVVTVSETSKRDIVELWGVNPDRVVAIPNGVGTSFSPGPVQIGPGGAGRPLRVLAVGTLQPRKNLLRLVEAVAIVGKRMPISLTIVGPDGFQAARIRDRLGASVQVDIAGYMSEELLAEEYRKADVFAYPSIYEGFGLPVVEAMASGTPVITSTTGSLPEVAGEAALLVDPLDVDAMARAIERIAEDPSLRQSLRSMGLARAAQFTWERTARQHADVYRDVVG